MTAQDTPAIKRMIRLPEVRQTVALSRSEIYRLISLGKFPAPVRLGERAVAWDFDDVQQWVRAKIDAHHKRTAGERQPC
jgi:prophage regulatory protein